MHDIAMQMIMRWARFGEDEIIDATSDFTRLTIDTLALYVCSIREKGERIPTDDKTRVKDWKLTSLASLAVAWTCV